jgi:hypothetical protein
MERIKNIQHLWDIVSSTPILCSVSHFIVSALISFFAYKLYRNIDFRYSDQLQTIEKIRNLQKLLAKNDINPQKLINKILNDNAFTILSYTIITGATASAIIEVQFPKGAHIPWAVMYGILGPYVLRDILLSLLGKTKKNESTITAKNSLNMADKMYAAEIENNIEFINKIFNGAMEDSKRRSK